MKCTRQRWRPAPSMVRSAAAASPAWASAVTRRTSAVTPVAATIAIEATRETLLHTLGQDASK